MFEVTQETPNSSTKNNWKWKLNLPLEEIEENIKFFK